MEKIVTRTVTITTTGGDGAATGAATFDAVHGFLLDVFNDWHASAPSSSVATLTYASPALGTIVACPATATDTLYSPRVHTHDHAGAETGLFEYFPLNGTVTMTVTLSNALTGALVCTLRYLAL